MEFYPFIMADGHFEIHCREDRLIAVRFDPLGPYRSAHDIKMGIIHRVILFRSGGDDSEGLRVDHLMAPVSGFADLAHSDTSIHTGDAHP